MTTTYITADLTVTQNVSSSNELVILQDASILTTSRGVSSTLATSYGIDVFLYGTVIASSIGLDFSGTSTGLADGYGGHTAYIGATGVLTSVFGGGSAALFAGTTNNFINYGEVSARGKTVEFEQGSGHTVLNYGSITSVADHAVYFGSTAEFTPTTGTNLFNNSGIISSANGIRSERSALNLTNSGEIFSTGTAIYVNNSANGSTILNTGLIQSGQVAISLGNANDIINNSGQIIGDIYLGSGNDVFNGIGGTVQGSIFGGFGDDEYFISEAGITLFEFFGEGIDHVYSEIDFTLGGNFENLTLIGDADLNGSGNTLANVISGNAGNNTLRSNGGNDLIYGNDGNDTILGGSGIDTLDGGDGNDKLRGLGNDDILTGGNGDDILRGNSGADLLQGGYGNDTLFGGRGGDTIDGGEGSDILDGGAGKDLLTGGLDADTFVFSRAAHSTDDANADKVTDFEVGIDRIDLSGLNTNLIFIDSASFSGVAGEVRVATFASKSLVRVDIDGDGTADMKIILTDAIGVTESDFIF